MMMKSKIILLESFEYFCVSNKIDYFRGSAEDVLSRYFETAKKFGSDIIIRITSDCPVIDPEVLDNMIGDFLTSRETEKIDYLSNTIVRTLPRGLDIEIFTFKALEKAHIEADNQYEHEHVTPYIYKHPEFFKLKNFTNEIDLSFHRWCVDTNEDLKLVEEIYNALYFKKELFLLNDILKLFDENPGLIDINKSAVQKKLGE